MGKIRIVTDGVVDLPQEWVARFNIKIVPVHVRFGDENFLSDGYSDRGWFYDKLTQSSVMPSTAAPSPYEFARVYQELAAEGTEDIVGLFAAASVSSIYDHAQLAARQLSSVRFHMVDTGQVSMGMGWLLWIAAEAIERGASAEEIVALVQSASVRTRVMGVLDSPEHLRRSGRIGWVVARFVELLQIKPLLCFELGQALLLGRVRTHHRALTRLVELVSEAAPLERLAVIHSRAPKALITQLQSALSLVSPEQPIAVVEVGPVFGAHIGPRCLGVAYVRSE
ncbi:MAG: DegV family protein [Anaerolineae bacterium]|nr:DegV family protein [Anaerolineae bacterium]